ncbi:MAG: DUF2281 domain-containing protein [Methanothrix sp.]
MDAFGELIAKLPPELQKEVWDFAQFLVEKKTSSRRKSLRLDWAGGLAEFKGKYASLELQKKSLDWWGD